MVQLTVLSLLCILSRSLSVEVPPLFSDECCTQKTVGGNQYTQVPGETDDFPNCKEDCVYEMEGKPGSRYCFQSGGQNQQKAECTEPFLNSSYVFVTRKTDKLIFKTDIGTFSCEITSETEEGENITCSEITDPFAEGIDEQAAFFYAQSDGETEWMCLHTDNEALHCDKGLKCHKVSEPGDPNILYVEQGGAAEGNTLTEQQNNCALKCYNRSFDCVFWTLSSDAGHTDRLHNPAVGPECGLRTYLPKVKLITNAKNQYAGLPSKDGNPKEMKVASSAAFVYEVPPNITDPTSCKNYCVTFKSDIPFFVCRTWTFDMTTKKCAINVYNPVRRIPTGSSKPTILSGCLDKQGFTCPKTPSG